MAATATTTGTPYLPAPRATVTVAGPRGGLDPRLYQIAALAGLLAYGLLRLDLEVQPVRAAIILATVARRPIRLHARMASAGLRSAQRPHLRPVPVPSAAHELDRAGHRRRRAGRSPASSSSVSAANTSSIPRTSRWWPCCSPAGIWVSPGQWGSAAFFGFLMACVGGLVVNRAARSDVTIAFLVAYAALVFGRSLWLGEPMAIPIHRLQNGALLLFAFFMISDPRTTPDRRAGRVLFAVLVALGAAYVQFRLFRTNGLLWSLAACSPLVPLIDRLLPAAPHRWPGGPLRRSA